MQSNIPPAITVVLPTFNGAVYVGESVESVLSQDGVDFELIVCDDGSSDETWEILQQYAGPRCRLLRNETNIGLFPTLNRLMAEARGDWVHLWSQDDRMLPGCLLRTTEFARSHPEVAMIYSRMRFIDDRGQVVSHGKDDSTPEVVSPLLAARIMYYYGSIAGNIANVSLRRDVATELGGFREDMKVSGDYELWVRLSEAHSIGFQSEPLIELRVHGEQFSKQPLSGAQFIKENREIKNRLLSRLDPTDVANARKYRRWVGQVNDFHHAVRCAARGDFKTAREVVHFLRAEAAVTPMALRWLVTANARFLPRPQFSVAEERVSF